MHESALLCAKAFYAKYCRSLARTAKIVDFGSYDVNGSLKPVFSEHDYIGVDQASGPNVDVVASNYALPFDESSIDVVVTSSTLEHDECFWESFLEMCRVVKPSGFIYVNAPSAGPYHGFPGDCWRFYKDAYPSLAKWAARKGHKIELIEAYTSPSKPWMDQVGVFTKTP